METTFDGELRLFLEELCCELCRLRHVAEDGVAAEDVMTVREVQLATPTAFADIVVTVPGKPAYFVEIKYGLSFEETVRSIRRKYAVNHRATCNRLIVVVHNTDTEALKNRLADCVCSSLDVEIWDEVRLLSEIKLRYGIEISGLSEASITTLHRSILQTNWRQVFDHDYYEILASALLWHFNPWTLKRLRERSNLGPEDIWRPGTYHDIAIVMGDISSFSAYVRDTPDQRVVQQILTAFYSHSRHAVHEYGGMFYQFVGDEVVGLFGFPDKKPGYIEDAVNCAKALLDIGASTSEHWERRIDRVQDKHGLHIGLAMGALSLLPLRPFARSHIGFIGDALNMSARLMAEAQPGEIVVSNAFYQALDEDTQGEFVENQPVVAKNVGTLRSWRRLAER
jgi:class 3 adenylate cyclase